MTNTARFLTLTAIVFGTLISSDTSAYGNEADAMKKYLWKIRPLVLFAPSPDSPVYRSVRNALSTSSGKISNRHMVIIEVFEDNMVQTNGKPDSQLDAAALRQRFSVEKGDLTVVLLGKDGGVKLRQSGRLHLDDIFSAIDRMPMRRQEMKESGE